MSMLSRLRIGAPAPDSSHRVKHQVEFNFEELKAYDDSISVLEIAKKLKKEEFKKMIDPFYTSTTPEKVTENLKIFLTSVSSNKLYTNEEEELALNAITKVIRVALIFQTTPLSDEEIAMMMSLNLAEGDLQQLIALGTNKHILELNKQLLKIYTMPTEDVPLMDTSEITYLGSCAIDSILLALSSFTADFDSTFLKKARNNFGIAVPKIIFCQSIDDVAYALELAVEHAYNIKELRLLFRKAFLSRFSNRLISEVLAAHFLCRLNDQRELKSINETMTDEEAGEEHDHLFFSRCMIAALSFGTFFNHQNSKKYDTRAKLMMEMAMEISEFSASPLEFFRTIEPTRLLYKIKSFYLEFQARKKCLEKIEDSDEASNLEQISKSVNIILFWHLEKIVSFEGDQRKLACMLIEHITLWTDSATLMANLAFRWATLTEYSLHALIVINVLILLVAEKPNFLSQPDKKSALSNFMKRTCEGILFNSKGNSFIDFANQQRKKHLKLIRPHPLINIEQQYNVAKGMKETFHLRSFLINMYFNTSESEWQEGRLLSSYHNLFNEDLPKIPENKIKTIPVYCANISIANEGVIITEERGLSSTNLFVDLKNSHETKSATRKRRKMNEVENFVKIALGKRNCLEAPNEIAHDVKRIYPAEQHQLGVDFQGGVGGNLHGPTKVVN